MKKLNKVKVIRISEEQHNTLVKMKSLKVDVGKFIREAIKEKIDKDYDYLKQKKETNIDSFSIALNKLIESN
tara:strand:+ start:233 stop:448 length:216 start_codon:yes stop_codon:yes gene_type:complete